MGEVDHVLIKHGIRITKNKSWVFFVIGPRIAVIYFLPSICKKHRVYYCWVFIWVRYPSVFTFKCLGKNIPHLFGITKHWFEAATAICSFLF